MSGVRRAVTTAVLLLTTPGMAMALEPAPAEDTSLVREIETSLCPASDDPLLPVSPARLRSVIGLGEAGRTALLAMAASPAHDRVCALDYLIELREPRAVLVLRPLAASAAEPPVLRAHAILGLAALHDRESVAIAAGLLEHGDRRLFRAALEALVTLDSAAAAPVIVALLKKGAYPAGYWALLVTRLAETREGAAIQALVEEAGRVDAGRGAHVARALVRVGTPDALDAAARIVSRLGESSARALATLELRRALVTVPAVP